MGTNTDLEKEVEEKEKKEWTVEGGKKGEREGGKEGWREGDSQEGKGLPRSHSNLGQPGTPD